MEARPSQPAVNKPPPEVEAAGLRAYEQAGAYETLHRRRLPLVYTALTILYVLGGVLMNKFDHQFLAEVCFATAVLLPLFFWWTWRRQNSRYEENLRLLADLEKTYGETLSWIQVERHFEALEKLQRELEQEKAAEARAVK
jgi:hypothetical protein